MLIDFKFKNYRSFKKEQIFSMKALSSKNKPDNVFEIETFDGKPMRLLRSAVLYGANASGKSNFIRAFGALQFLILKSSNFNVGDSIPIYDPYRFDSQSSIAPTEFVVSFLDDKFIRYEYKISFNKEKIVKESLDYYPLGYKANLYERQEKQIPDSLLHEISLGKNFQNKRVEKKILPNQLFLSKIGGNTGHEQLTPIYKVLSNITVWNALENINELVSYVSKKIIKKEESLNLANLSKLIRIADTQINGVEIKTATEKEFNFPAFISEKEKKQLVENFKYRPYTIHNIFSNNKKVGTETLNMEEGSAGTKILFALGGLILEALKSGKTIFLDEIDNSLHPKLCRFLIRLFHHHKTNKQNAQMIFATHEVSLLDKTIFRKDQIWFAEKNKQGESEMFSAQDFEDIRDNSPFDKLYMAGKFGGYPKIKELEFINEYE